jgi:hypothetical protein
LSRVRAVDQEKWFVGLIAAVGSLLLAVGLIGSDVRELQPVCYVHDLFVYCLQSNPQFITVHETYLGLVAFGAFLLVGCGLMVLAGLKWPPRRS